VPKCLGAEMSVKRNFTWPGQARPVFRLDRKNIFKTIFTTKTVTYGDCELQVITSLVAAAAGDDDDDDDARMDGSPVVISADVLSVTHHTLYSRVVGHTAEIKCFDNPLIGAHEDSCNAITGTNPYCL